MSWLSSRAHYFVGLLLAVGSCLLIVTSGMLPTASPTSLPETTRSTPIDSSGAYAQAAQGRYGNLLFKEQLEQNTRDLQTLLTNLGDIRLTSEFQKNANVKKVIGQQVSQIQAAVVANRKILATFDRLGGGGPKEDFRRLANPTVALAIGPEVESPVVWLPLAQFTTGVVGVMLSLFVILFGNGLLAKVTSGQKHPAKLDKPVESQA